MIIINGINSEIAKKIIPKFLNKNKVIGIYNSSYTGIQNKNLILFKKNKISLQKIEAMSKKDQKICFINFAAKRDENLLINTNQKLLNKIFQNNLTEPLELLKKIIPLMMIQDLIQVYKNEIHGSLKPWMIYVLKQTQKYHIN